MKRNWKVWEACLITEYNRILKKFSHYFILLIPLTVPMAVRASLDLTGIVTDVHGVAQEGVEVRIESTDVVDSTDSNGRYDLSYRATSVTHGDASFSAVPATVRLSNGILDIFVHSAPASFRWELFDLQGRRVDKQSREFARTGQYRVALDGSSGQHISSKTYILRSTCGRHTTTHKLVISGSTFLLHGREPGEDDRLVQDAEHSSLAFETIDGDGVQFREKSRAPSALARKMAAFQHVIRFEKEHFLPGRKGIWLRDDTLNVVDTFKLSRPWMTQYDTGLVIFREEYKNERRGEFFIWPDSSLGQNKFYLNSNYIPKLIALYPDTFDFLIIVPAAITTAGNGCVPFIRNVLGIGRDSINLGGSFFALNLPKMKAEITLNLMWRYTVNNGKADVYLPSLLHELGHTWCCDLKGLYPDKQKTVPGSHWRSVIDFFYGDTVFQELMKTSHWAVLDGRYKCVDGRLFQDSITFSDLSLYVMGFLPGEQLKPLTLLLYDTIPSDDFAYFGYNTYGPPCITPDPDSVFTGLDTLTFAEIEELNGNRVPSYEKSQKNFTALFLVIYPYGREVDTTFMTLVNDTRKALPAAWNKATRGESTISFPHLEPRITDE